jgi:hypothetical protein
MTEHLLNKLASILMLFLFLAATVVASESVDILVITGSQSADGVTQNDFDMKMLAAIELMTKNKVKEKMDSYLTAQGVKDAKFEVIASSVYVNVQSMKLAVVKLKIESSNQVHIYGVKGDELLRVVCLGQTKEPVPISNGKCAQAIKKVYGVDFLKGSN